MIGNTLWVSLFLFLWSLPTILAITIESITYPYLTSTDGLFWVFAILKFATLVLLLYKSISYSMANLILCDNYRIDCRKALKLSIDLTKGHIGHIFILWLSFIGWLLLALLPLLFWLVIRHLYPYNGDYLLIGLVLFICVLVYMFLFSYFNRVYVELYAQLRDNGLHKKAV